MVSCKQGPTSGVNLGQPAFRRSCSSERVLALSLRNHLSNFLHARAKVVNGKASNFAALRAAAPPHR